MSSPAPIRRGYADMASGQLHYRYCGNSGAPVLVLLHQAPSHGVMYEAMMHLLAGQFFCIAPDLPGCGQSDALSDYSIEAIAASLAATLNTEFKLAQRQLYLFGHHTGASVAAELVAYHWPQAAALVLSGPPLLSAAQQLHLQRFNLPAKAEDSGQFLTELWQFIRSKDSSVALSVSLRESLAALQLAQGYPALYRAVASHNFASALAQINCPTLLFAGQRDALRTALPASQALLRYAEVAEIGDFGTYVCEQAAAQVSQLIIDFCLRSSFDGSGTS